MIYDYVRLSIKNIHKKFILNSNLGKVIMKNFEYYYLK